MGGAFWGCWVVSVAFGAYVAMRMQAVARAALVAERAAARVEVGAGSGSKTEEYQELSSLLMN